MGNDGGSIPTRTDLVRFQGERGANERARNNEEARRMSWRSCAISKEPLRQPVVICSHSLLYNKEAVLYLLLNRKLKNTFDDSINAFTHIKSLKDVRQLRLHEENVNETSFCCPISGRPMNGLVPFKYLRGCGCVFSAYALSNIIPSSPAVCPSCNADRSESDECVILSSGFEIPNDLCVSEKQRLPNVQNVASDSGKKKTVSHKKTLSALKVQKESLKRFKKPSITNNIGGQY